MSEHDNPHDVHQDSPTLEGAEAHPTPRLADGQGAPLHGGDPSIGAGDVGGRRARADTPDAELRHQREGSPGMDQAGSPPLRDEVEATTHADRTGAGVPLQGSLAGHPPLSSTSGADTPMGGGTGPARTDPSAVAEAQRAAAREGPKTPQGYPIHPTATGLPVGSGSGGSRPHLDVQFDALPEEGVHEGEP